MKTDMCAVIIISRSLLLRMRNVSDKSCTENRNNFFFPKNHVIYEIMWKITVEPDRPQMTT